MNGLPSDAQFPPTSNPPTNQKPKATSPPPKLEGYDIIAPLGEGGMGTVWRAVQVSTCREVALKVLGKGVFGSEKARARFEREVELTARLQHPNIARIYDRGAHNGICYYAMELIEGVPLDRYAEENCLPQREILSLMFAVCQAVQHAHERGIIHRDLKPSNILVTSDGQPHLLDFGVAKAFVEEDSDLSISTDGGPAGTPAYMSPEQAAGHLEEVDTRTDVYALGVILFQLLTRQTPHALSGTRYEVLRRVAEEEIRRPREISKDIDRELEALLLKALARDPKDRYPSAGALAQDMENHLEGEPLDAKRPTTAYFLWKRVRKYRFRVAAAAAVLSILLGTAVFAYVRIAREEAQTAKQRDKAMAESDKARREADRAEASYEFLQNMLSELKPAGVRGQGIALGETLMDAAQEGEAGLPEQPEVEAEVRHTIGCIYLALAEANAAEMQFSRALEIRRRTLGQEHPDTLASMNNLALALEKKGDHFLSEHMLRRAIQIQERVLGKEHPDRLVSMSNLGITLTSAGKLDQAETILRECSETQRRIQGQEHRDTLNSMISLANTLVKGDRLAEAEELLRECLRIQERAPGDWTKFGSTLVSEMNLAVILKAKGKLGTAEQMLRRCVQGQEFFFGKDVIDAVKSKMHLAILLLEKGDLDEAKEMLSECCGVERPLLGEKRFILQTAQTAAYNVLLTDPEQAEASCVELVERSRRELGEEHPNTIKGMLILALAFLKKGDFDSAEQTWRESLEIARRALGDEHPFTLCSMMNLSSILERRGRHDEAEKIHRDLFETCQRLTQEGRSDALDIMTEVPRILGDMGELDEAQAQQERILEMYRHALGEEHPQALKATRDLAFTLARRGSYEHAGKMLSDCLETQRRILGKEHPDTLGTMGRQAFLLGLKGQHDLAAGLWEECFEVQSHVLGKEHQLTLFSLEKLESALREKVGYSNVEVERRITEIHRRVLGDGHRRTLGAMQRLAKALEEKGMLAEAEATWRDIVEIRGPANAWSVGALADVLRQKGNLDEAEAFLRQSMSIANGTLAEDDMSRLRIMGSLASVLEAKGDWNEAEAILRERVEILQRAEGEDYAMDNEATIELADFLEKRGKVDERVALLSRRLEIREQAKGKEDPETLASMNDLANTLWKMGRLDEVEALNRRNLEIRQGSQGREHPDTLWAMGNLALVLREQGKFEEADALNKECLEIQGKVPDATSDAAPAEGDSTVLARDDFDGKLALDWKILDPDPTHTSLAKNPGTLTITAKYGGNVFLLSPPTRATEDFEVTTCISSFQPSDPYHQAGLIVHDGNDNYVKFVGSSTVRFCNPLLLWRL